VREARHPDTTPLPGVGVRSKSGRALQWPPANGPNATSRCHTRAILNSVGIRTIGSSPPVGSKRTEILHGSRATAVVVAPRKIGNHGSPRKRVKRVTPRATTSPAGHLWGMHVPDYLLFVAYGLFAVAVIACLAFVARNFEDEDPQPRRSNRDR
jgi:hypothetical protein